MDSRLKKFIEDNIPVEELIESGFFLKGTKKTDYESIAARICWYFDYKSIYEYTRPTYTQTTDTTITGYMGIHVNEKGKIKKNGGFHIDIAQTDFSCPHCTCPNDISSNKRFSSQGYTTVKCSGCKRKVFVASGMGGELVVKERSFNRPCR